MVITKYNRGDGQYTIGSQASINSRKTETTTTSNNTNIDCQLWGNQFDGLGDVEDTMYVNGSLYAMPKMYEKYVDEEEGNGEPNDNDGEIDEFENKSFEPYDDDEGGNVYAQNLVRSDKVYGKTLFLDYPQKIETTDPMNIDETNKKDLLDVLKMLIPIGSIIMHNGSIDKAKLTEYGWAVCDGSNGTPNLVNKFIKGGTSAGFSSGRTEVTLTTANLPSHSHTYNAPNGTSSAGSHSHSVTSSSTSVAQGEGTTAYPIGSVSDTSTNGSHSHTVNTTSSNTSSVGSGTPFNIEPPYYTLIYIQRIW